MRKLLCVAAACCLAGFAFGEVIFDNGGPDGSNGLSAGNFSFGYRECTDDFVLDPEWPLYNIDDGHFSYIWNTVGFVPTVEVQVAFYDDDGTTKPVMDPFETRLVPGVGTLTGDYYFGRPEVVYDVEFDCVVVPSDVPFWVSFTIMDPPENGFWMTSAIGYGGIFRDEAYVDMADAGHPRWTPTSIAFGTPYDLSFYLTGYGFPEPATLSLLGIGALALLRRR